ncbi:MAG TPA: hypothetical protein VNZ64_02375 [Candidatus Acidoferrum sp.]|jgi:hypothetical protein|nr:hypothetical protein [Candidatus Acidoferrum sp.]
MDEATDIIAAKKAVVGAWLSRPGVTGMDVGFKYVGGKRTSDVAIRLFVRKKLADVAPDERFPSLIGKHKTDVIECELKPCGPPDTAYYNPMVGGVQLYSSGWEGTAGMFVRDNATGQLMILGTFHGDIAPNTAIYQPLNTPQPDGTLGQIGYLIRGGHYLTPPVDADLILFGAPRDTNFIIQDLGCVKGVATVEELMLSSGVVLFRGMPVTKRGKTTLVTHGSLDGVSYSQPYPPDYKGNVITYDNMLTFAGDPTTSEPLGKSGDSGSVILDSNNNAVALLTLGSPYSATGPSNAGPAFPDILAALNVTPCFCGTTLPRKIILTSSESPAPPPIDRNGQIIGAWGQSVTGKEAVPSPGRPPIQLRWTITNVYQSLEFRATVVGFDQPVFRWSINGQTLNQFNADAFTTVSVKAVVRTDSQIAQGNTLTFEGVNLSIGAFHKASYDVKGTYSSLVITPTAVQGHIMLMVEVEVCNLSSASLNPMSPTPTSPQSAPATLDTQVLTFGH